MTVDNTDVSTSVDRSMDTMVKQPGEQKRLESLLLDGSDSMQAVEQIVDQEMKAVENGKASYSGSLIILSLLCLLLLLGGGYSYLQYLSSSQPSVAQMSFYVSPKLPIPIRQTNIIPVSTEISSAGLNVVSAKESDSRNKASDSVSAVPAEIPLFTVSVGPFIGDIELQQAISWLQELGFKSQQQAGSGQVSMIRLLEGVYPEVEAKEHLAALKKVVDSAFLMPDGAYLAVYAGSFHQEDRAQQLQENLAQKMVNVTLIDSEVTLNGTMLTVLQADQKTAREVAAHISSLGLHTQIVEEK